MVALPHSLPDLADFADRIATERLCAWVLDARLRSIELLADLDAGQLAAVPLLPTVNPLVWELCHLAYFQELWVLRVAGGQEPWRDDVDALFDSMTIAHENRWRLPVPTREQAFDYVESVAERVVELLERRADPMLRYLTAYSVFHEDMHAEALAYTRQALGLPAPKLGLPTIDFGDAVPSIGAGDYEVAGGSMRLGAERDAAFVFDNEKWAHEVVVEPFAIACAAVTEGEFADFVRDSGYLRDELWSPEGRAWRTAHDVTLPAYWRRAKDARTFERREFDRWVSLEARRAMVHANYYEAEAFCAWAGRRLPSEAEWEFVAREGAHAAQWPDPCDGTLRCVAALDFACVGAVSVDAGGASVARDETAASRAGGPVRQLCGNVWEWTSSTFAPYPGFVADMYSDYSQFCFGTRKVLRGGCFATRARLLRPTWRNFFQPARRDVFAGFRTCART